MEAFNKIFNVIEDNSQQIPEGVYLQLMNLLKDQHKELNNNNIVINEPVQPVQAVEEYPELILNMEEEEPEHIAPDFENQALEFDYISVENLRIGDITKDYKNNEGFLKVVKITDKTVQLKRLVETDIDYKYNNNNNTSATVRRCNPDICDEKFKVFIIYKSKSIYKFTGNRNNIIYEKISFY